MTIEIKLETLNELNESLKRTIEEIKHSENGKALYRLGSLQSNLDKNLKEIDNNVK